MTDDDRTQHETQQDPVIFGPDPFTHERPPAEDDQPTYRPPTRWPVLIGILLVVIVLVGAVGLWVL